MAYINWSSDLNTGIESIDLQHIKLVDMINEFYEELSKDREKALGTLLDGLIEYTVYHFGVEEKYFAKIGYEKAIGHVQGHHYFIDKINQAKSRLAEKLSEPEKMALIIDMSGFLRAWIIKHIQVEDKSYAPIFKEHGIT